MLAMRLWSSDGGGGGGGEREGKKMSKKRQNTKKQTSESFSISLITTGALTFATCHVGCTPC